MSRRALLWALAVGAALALPAPSLAGRTTVGLRPGADRSAVSAAIERVTGESPTTLAPLRALSVDAPAAAIRCRERRVALCRTEPVPVGWPGRLSEPVAASWCARAAP